MDGNIKNNPKRPQDKPKEQRNDPPQEQWQDPPQEQPHGQPHEQQEAQVSHAPRHGVVDGGDAADDNEAAAAAQEEGEEEEKEEEEKEEEEEEAVVILRVTEVGETEDTAPCCIVDQDTGRAWSVRILNRLEQRLQSGKFSLSDGVWDDTFNHFFSFYPQLMPFATRFVSQLPQEHRWDLFRIGRGDNDPEVTSRDLLDEFFQALARREIGKFFLYGDLPSELLQSFALQFYQARHGNDNKLLDELHVNSRAMLGQPAGVPDCPLLLIAKKVSLGFSSFGEPFLPFSLGAVFQNIHRAVRQGGENQQEQPLTIDINFGDLLRDVDENVALLALSNLSRDFPFINYGIEFLWDGQNVPKFISGVDKVVSLTLNPILPGRRAAVDFQYAALPKEYCDEVSNAIRSTCVLENLTLASSYFNDTHNGKGEGHTDLVKSVVAGLDKNSSLRKLVIHGVRTGFHGDLWTALAKNKDARLESLEIIWNKSDAGTLWEGLESNKSLLKVTCANEDRETRMDPFGSWHGFLDPLLQRNKLLCKAEAFSREDRKPHEFVEHLCALSAERMSYFDSTSDNISKRDEVYRACHGFREPLPLPANFSALFVTIRKYLPHFVNSSILIKIPLKNCTEEDLRTIDFDAYGDFSGESRETLRRVHDEMKRRIRESSRRIRELE